jgi:hypothetical protein
MKNSNRRIIAVLTFVLFAGFLSHTNAFAQESKVKDNPKMEADDSKMSWADFKKDVHAKYNKVMGQVDHIEKEAKEKKIADPNFKKAVNRFQEKAKDFAERLKNSENVTEERQDKYRSEMRSQLKKLNKEYERLKNKWEDIRK